MESPGPVFQNVAMKITQVEPIAVGIPYDHGAPKPVRHGGFGAWDSLPILFVRVETDAGIVGWGEAFGHASTPATQTAISDIIAKLAVANRVEAAAVAHRLGLLVEPAAR